MNNKLKILSDLKIEKSWNPEKSYLNNGTAPEHQGISKY